MKRKGNSLDALFGETLPERTVAKPNGTWLDATQAEIEKTKDNRWTIECDPGLEGLCEVISKGRFKVVTRKR
jgi:hypothetical protein